MISWFRRLDSSPDIASVLEVVRAYVASFSAEELAQLPMPCRPGSMRSAGELEGLRGTLVEEYRLDRLTGEARGSLQRLTSLVVRASVRLAELQDEDDRDDPPPAPGKREASARRDRDN